MTKPATRTIDRINAQAKTIVSSINKEKYKKTKEKKQSKPKATPTPKPRTQRERKTSRRWGVSQEPEFVCRKTEKEFSSQIVEIVEWLTTIYPSIRYIWYTQEEESNQFIVNAAHVIVPSLTRFELLNLLNLCTGADAAVSITGAAGKQIQINIIDTKPTKKDEQNHTNL